MLGSALIMLAVAGVSPGAPINDPVQLNIGISCRWEPACMQQQRRAMKKSLAYVAKYHPPLWRIEQCNRNASRGTAKVDWTGFNNCVRNAGLAYRPPPPPPAPPAKTKPRKKKRR